MALFFNSAINKKINESKKHLDELEKRKLTLCNQRSLADLSSANKVDEFGRASRKNTSVFKMILKTGTCLFYDCIGFHLILLIGLDLLEQSL